MDVKYSIDAHKIIVIIKSNIGFFLNGFKNISIANIPYPYIGIIGPVIAPLLVRYPNCIKLNNTSHTYPNTPNVKKSNI